MPPREQPTGTEEAYTWGVRRKNFVPSANFGLQRLPARAHSRHGPDPETLARPTPPQAPRPKTSKVGPGGLGLLISLPW